MIGLAKACSGGATLGNYVVNLEKGYELDRNLLCGSTGKEIMDEMKILQSLNHRATNKTFSLVLSPYLQEGKHIQDFKLKQIVREYMIELGINPEKQQFIAFVHTEKEHKHVHIIANRVLEDGSLISDHHIGKRAQWAAHRIAKEWNLTSAKEKQIENIQNLNSNENEDKYLKQLIYHKHITVMNSLPYSFSEYQKSMKNLNIEVLLFYNKQGIIQGLRLRDLDTGLEYKASDIHRDLALNKILKSGIVFKLKDDLNKVLKSVYEEGQNKTHQSKHTKIKSRRI